MLQWRENSNCLSELPNANYSINKSMNRFSNKTLSFIIKLKGFQKKLKDFQKKKLKDISGKLKLYEEKLNEFRKYSIFGKSIGSLCLFCGEMKSLV